MSTRDHMLHMPTAQQCPICGENNQCAQEKALATGEPLETCWCFSQAISPAVLDKLPEPSRGLQCVCQRCASKRTDLPNSAEAT